MDMFTRKLKQLKFNGLSLIQEARKELLNVIEEEEEVGEVVNRERSSINQIETDNEK